MPITRGGKPGSDGLYSVNIRVEPDIYRDLVGLAEKEHRSLGQQARLIFERALVNSKRSHSKKPTSQN